MGVRSCNDAVKEDQRETMLTVTLPRETWRAAIAILREKALPYMLEHDDRLEQRLEQHRPDQAIVPLILTDDVFLRLFNSTRWQLGIPLPPTDE